MRLAIGTGVTTASITKTAALNASLPSGNYYKCAGAVEDDLTMTSQ